MTGSRPEEPETPPDAGRLYAERRGKAHFVKDQRAYCGIWRSDWRGTGTQDEYDEAKRRRLCSRCVRRAVWRWGS